MNSKELIENSTNDLSDEIIYIISLYESDLIKDTTITGDTITIHYDMPV
jgi:hypothetical protein